MAKHYWQAVKPYEVENIRNGKIRKVLREGRNVMTGEVDSFIVENEQGKKVQVYRDTWQKLGA